MHLVCFGCPYLKEFSYCTKYRKFVGNNSKDICLMKHNLTIESQKQQKKELLLELYQLSPSKRGRKKKGYRKDE